MKLRQSHIYQMLSYLKDCEDSGWYYGNKQQFFKRHKEIKEWLENLLERHGIK